MLVFADGSRYSAEANCDGFQCSYTLLGATISFDLDELDPTGALMQFLGQTRETNGISHAIGTFREEGFDYDVYAGWGDYQAFLELFGTATENGTTINVMIPLSLGNSASTNPVAGSATWNGIMVGRLEKPQSFYREIGNRITGDASIVADFSSAAVDVVFSQIVEYGGSPLQDMRWEGLTIEDGGFHGDGLYGLFYGPNHEEAGGIFEVEGRSGSYRSVSGVFGAVRQ